MLGNRVVVTGASGHLGNVLVRELVRRDADVTATVVAGHESTALDSVPVRTVACDVREPASLVAAFRGADVVFHLAGLVSITAGREEVLRSINVSGTRNVIDACIKAGVSRLVYMSSVHALPEPLHGGVMAESEFDVERAYGAYGKSKAAASRMVEQVAQDQQLDTVLVLPSGVVGPLDFRFGEAGQMVAMAATGKLPVIVAGGHGWVDVRDVATATIAASEHGRTGHSYLVDGGYRSARDIGIHLAGLTGAHPPRVVLPLAVARPMSYGGLVYERITGRRSLFTPYSMHVVGARYTISIERAASELGFAPRPLDETFADAWKWLQSDSASPLKRRKKYGPGRTG